MLERPQCWYQNDCVWYWVPDLLRRQPEKLGRRWWKVVWQKYRQPYWNIFLLFWLPISETVQKELVIGRTVQLVCNIYDVIKKVRSHSLVSIALLMIPLYDLYRFIISLDRDISYVFTFLLDTALSAYATEIACLQSFSEYILLPVSCTLLSAAASLPFPVGCPRRSAWHGRECAVEAYVLPLSFPSHPFQGGQTRGVWSLRFSLFASWNICGCSRPTVKGQCTDLPWFEDAARIASSLAFLTIGHVPFTLPLRTHTFVMASVRRSTYFHTFSAYLVVYVVTVWNKKHYYLGVFWPGAVTPVLVRGLITLEIRAGLIDLPHYQLFYDSSIVGDTWRTKFI